MPLPVFAIVWFDIEDFISPETDDAPLRVANLMKKHGIRVSFRLVGEKLRQLKRSNRTDVIEALSQHEIGYHSNLHSLHPTISEYVGNLGWDEGAEEFERREEPGYEEVKATFGRNPTSFGHPNLCWVPQAYAALNEWSIPVFLNETYTISPLNQRPFWYCNLLNFAAARSHVVCLNAGGGSSDLPDDQLTLLRDTVVKIYNELAADEDVGVIHAYCTPNTYIAKDWWETANFLHGKNPKDMRFKKPRLKSPKQTEKDFGDLERLMVLMKSLPGIRFITPSDALEIYADKSLSRRFTIPELTMLAEKAVESINYERVANVYVSPAQVFSMIIQSLVDYSETGKLPETVIPLRPLGPRARKKTKGTGRIDFKAFLRSATSVLDEIKTGYLPELVSIGDFRLSTGDTFTTACSAYLELAKGPKKAIRSIKPLESNFEIGRMVTLKGARVDWSHNQTNPVGFEAPMQTELARLQCWTLKPAVPDQAKLGN